MADSRSLKTIASNTFWCLRLIFRFNPILFSFIFITEILAASIPFLRNKIFAQLIDSIVYHQGSLWLSYFLIFIIFLALAAVFSFIQNQLSRIIDTKLQSQLRTMFIKKVSGLDYQHLEGKDTSNLISKVDDEFGFRMRQTVSDAGSVFINIISLIAVTVIILPKYPIIWFLIFVSQIPQYLIEKYWIQKDWRLRELNSDKNKLMWDLNYQLRTKNFVAELRINNAVDFMYKKFQETFEFFTNGRVKLRTQQVPSELALILLSTSIGGVCLFLLLTDVQKGLITIGLFTFFFQTIQQTSDLFRGLVLSSVNITENSYHIGNFRQVINLQNIISGGAAKVVPPLPPVIEFVDVSFHYPDSKHFVYRHLNLVINAGEEIAIVGPNGAGKSTLIKLLCHFYNPTSGKILINGIDLKKINLDNWYRQLSYLAQEFNYYSNLDLRESVGIGNPSKFDDRKILDALKKSDASFTKNYPQGLDTLMSHRYGGEEPSWGQMQKIAIARVFYRDSSIIILDEPTASIDAVSESKIFNRLYTEIKGKTLLIVSHRFSTVRNAKRIIVIEKGKIVEQGSHEQLLALKGIYAHSFNLQARGYSD